MFKAARDRGTLKPVRHFPAQDSKDKPSGPTASPTSDEIPGGESAGHSGGRSNKRIIRYINRQRNIFRVATGNWFTGGL